MAIIAKTIMQIGSIVLDFLGVSFYVSWRSELIFDKKIKYLPDREMILGRIVSVLIFVLAGVIV